MGEADDTKPIHVHVPGAGGSTPGSLLLQHALTIAFGEVGVEETSRNRGGMVDVYIRSVGLDPAAGSYPWCCCFSHWVFDEASKQLHMPRNPHVRTAGVLVHWQKAPPVSRIKVHPGGVIVDRERVRPGCIFIQDHGEGRGHTGIVTGVDFRTGELATVEGNTDPTGGREGDGVYRRTRNLSDSKLIGFIDYGVAVDDVRV